MLVSHGPFIDSVTYARAKARVTALEKYIHNNMHRNVPMEECKLCQHLREEGENERP